ncbi:MAG: AraC family transcriptional regulator [Bacteroidetes bacterium]|nr:MAG: AraC family transcriptional regulator [Bacteroidota bacterium]
MVVIPDRLFNEPFIKLIHRSRQQVILEKELSSSIFERQSYVSMYGISIVMQGQQRILEDSGKILTINPGEIGIIRKGLYTVTDILPKEKNFQSYHIFLSEQALREVLNTYGISSNQENGQGLLKFQAPDLIKEYFIFLKTINPATAYSYQIFTLKIMEFFGLLINENPSVAKQLAGLLHQPFKNLQAFMEDHFSKPLSIKDYASLTGRSESTFRREFKLKYGIAPRKWIINKRMEMAKKLLEDADFNVNEVAMEVGYDNVSHFIKAYKNVFGETPGNHQLTDPTILS